MLSRISRLGVSALNRARAGQNSVSSRNHEETIRCYVNHVVRGTISSVPPQMLKPATVAMSVKLNLLPAPKNVIDILQCQLSPSLFKATFLQAAECLLHGLYNVSVIDPHRTPPVIPREYAVISVTFVDKDGVEKLIKVPIGMSMLEAAHENDIELEGACEGSLACSTCHVIVTDVDYYNKLEDPEDEENDMLDLAFGLTETSRLGCQVIASPELDGIRLALPAATRNFVVDGHVAKSH